VSRLFENYDLTNVSDEFSAGEEVNIQELLVSQFYTDQRLFKHYSLLMWFPKYMKLFFETQLLVMDNNEFGSDEFDNDAETNLFPSYVNYYIAIQAVSCYKCEYLLYILQEQFLLSGGPLEWLIYGLEKVDPKVRRIAEINEIMAYKPWAISKEHIAELLEERDNLPKLTI